SDLRSQRPEKEGKEITLNYLTPHNKWSIHSMYFDSQPMLTLFRGGPTVWLNKDDAEEIDVEDNDWIECFNRNGVVVARAVVSQDRKSTRLNSSHVSISYAVCCLK